MKKLHRVMLLFMALGMTLATLAQNSVTISGNIKNSKSKETVSAVSITIKGTSYGTYTDENGNFKLTTTQKPPFTIVISSVGYAEKEIQVTTNNQVVNVELDTKYSVGDEVVVSASRVAEKILESPVSVERVSAAKIRTSPATSYYDIIGNQKGVDILTSSLTFKTPSTRGFVGSGNLRFNQLIDGMDNQAPGLNFSVGSVIGLTELDVESMELLAGASSALYGPGGMNGTLLINSKDPFKYQGLSFQIKQGVNHVDNYQRNAAAFYDWSVRWAKKLSDKFAFKIGAQFVQAQDWSGVDARNYSRSTGSPNGQVKGGTRTTDPNYDGVNFYGDETTTDLRSSIAALAGNPSYAPFLSPIVNNYSRIDVSRTGYDERSVVDPTTLNFKLTGALVYKITPAIDASLSGYFGTGNTVYTGSDRYSLKDLRIAQYKFEVKHRNWFVRAYTTQENAGASFNATITTRLFNEAWKPSQTAWYPQYVQGFVTAAGTVFQTALAGGQTVAQAQQTVLSNYMNIHNTARGVADQGRPTGFIGNNSLFKNVAGTPISKGGGLFLDRSDLYNVEGQYNLSEDLKIKDKGWDLLVGGNWKTYVLNSQGTLFADTAGTIKINEVGAYLQLQKKLFNDKLKLTASGRYDKNTNFKGRFTPRASAVISVAKDHNIRLSYQTAYRFPSTQNQWINLLVSGGVRLMGGLPQLRDYYGFGTRKGYTISNVTAFGTAFATNVAQQGGNPASPTPTQAATALAATQNVLQAYNFGEFKPESSTSYEIGYKGLINKTLLIDVYGYYAQYKDFLGSVTLLQTKTSSATAPLELLSSSTRNTYNIAVNLSEKIKSYGWGVSAEYLLPKNFSVTANVYSDQLKDAPDRATYATYFNAPKYRFNIGFSNSGFLYKNNVGFSVIYRWQDDFYYEGSFGAGDVKSFGTVDAMVSYKFPAAKSLVKLGATNVLNKYYTTGWGQPQIGGLYYVSYAFNVF